MLGFFFFSHSPVSLLFIFVLWSAMVFRNAYLKWRDKKPETNYPESRREKDEADMLARRQIAKEIGEAELKASDLRSLFIKAGLESATVHVARNPVGNLYLNIHVTNESERAKANDIASRFLVT